MLKRKETGQAPPPTEFYPDIPPEVVALVMRMLRSDAGDRHSNCGEVASALKAAKREALRRVHAAQELARKKAASARANPVDSDRRSTGGTGTPPPNSQLALATYSEPPTDTVLQVRDFSSKYRMGLAWISIALVCFHAVLWGLRSFYEFPSFVLETNDLSVVRMDLFLYATISVSAYVLSVGCLLVANVPIKGPRWISMGALLPLLFGTVWAFLDILVFNLLIPLFDIGWAWAEQTGFQWLMETSFLGGLMGVSVGCLFLRSKPIAYLSLAVFGLVFCSRFMSFVRPEDFARDDYNILLVLEYVVLLLGGISILIDESHRRT